MWGIPDSPAMGRLHHCHMAIHTNETTTTLTRTTTTRTTKKGWHDDPRAEHKLRFHDGDAWTEHTTHHGPVPCLGCHR